MTFFQKIRDALLPPRGHNIWASEKGIQQAGLSPAKDANERSGIIIGRNPYTRKIMLAHHGENVLLVAPSRSGKSVGIVIPTVLFWKDSFIALDYKGELWEMTAGYRKRYLKQTVMKFQSFCTDGNAVKWNPLTEIRFGTRDECGDADAISDLLITGQPCPDAEIARKAKTALAKVILHLYHEQQSVPTLFEVSEFFLSSKQAMVINDAMADARTSLEVLQWINQSLAVYRDSRVRENTSRSDVSIRDLLDPKQKISFYITFGCEEYFAQCQIERLFVSMLQRAVAATDGTSQAENPHLLLMLDNFVQLGHLPYCEPSLAHGNAHGIQSCIVVQDVSQLNKIYTKDNFIMGNCHVQIYFTPTNNESMKVLSDKLGMTPNEVAYMNQKKELVFVGGYRPIYSDKIRFYLEPYFKKRVLTPPPSSDLIEREAPSTIGTYHFKI